MIKRTYRLSLIIEHIVIPQVVFMEKLVVEFERITHGGLRPLYILSHFYKNSMK